MKKGIEVMPEIKTQRQKRSAQGGVRDGDLGMPFS